MTMSVQRFWREQRGAALIEYVLIFPLFLLLFLGSLEIFRLLSVQQSLRTGLREGVACLCQWKDEASRPYCDPIAEIVQQLDPDRNPFSLNPQGLALYVNDIPYPDGMLNLAYGDVFVARAEVMIPLGYLYPFERGPIITVRVSQESFVGSSPQYFKLWRETPFPIHPAALP
jgi:hypothetical protein